jgi:glycosyltransferase involved in cell wall biosynthesis
MQADRITIVNSAILQKRQRLVIVFTSSGSVAFYFGLYKYLEGRGFDVSVISSEGPELEAASREGVSVFAVPMEREISPGRDLISLWRLWRLIRRISPDIIQVGTPKAGLLGGLAGLLAGVPHRVYTLHGLRLETTRGWKRILLTYTERFACYCAHRVRCVGPSLLKRALELKLVEPGKTTIIGPGTSGGIDVARFHSPNEAIRDALALRHNLGIPGDALVVGFVGRVTRDKSIRELYLAFVSKKEKHPNMRLLLVGDFEAGDPVPEDIRRAIEDDQSVIRTAFISDVAPYYHLMDIFVLPTYREGLPGVPLEAQAAGVPVITTRATGAIDSVLDQQTGFLVPVGDTIALSAAIDRLLGDSSLRKRMGEAGRAWVASTFRREIVWAANAEAYEQLASREEDKQPCAI